MKDLQKTDAIEGEEFHYRGHGEVYERVIQIDVIIATDHEISPYFGLSNTFTITRSLNFTASVMEPWGKIMEFDFVAEFTDGDLSNEEALVGKICEQLKHRKEVRFYANRASIPAGASWETIVVLSPMAKEIFEFLLKYKPRLIEAFGF